MNQLLSNSNIFPFSLGSENLNTRKAEITENDDLAVEFDLTSQNSPECAAVAIIFNGKHDFPENFELTFKKISGDDLYLTIDQKGKYEEVLINKEKPFTLHYELKSRMIVICCLQSKNLSKSGKYIISARS